MGREDATYDDLEYVRAVLEEHRKQQRARSQAVSGRSGRARVEPRREPTLKSDKAPRWVLLGPYVLKLTLKSQPTLTLARFDPCPLSTAPSSPSFPRHWPCSLLNHSLTDKRMAHPSATDALKNSRFSAVGGRKVGAWDGGTSDLKTESMRDNA